MRFFLAVITPLGVPKLDFASDRGILILPLFLHIFSIISPISKIRKTENPQIGKSANPQIPKSKILEIRKSKKSYVRTYRCTYVRTYVRTYSYSYSYSYSLCIHRQLCLTKIGKSMVKAQKHIFWKKTTTTAFRRILLNVRSCT